MANLNKLTERTDCCEAATTGREDLFRRRGGCTHRNVGTPTRASRVLFFFFLPSPIITVVMAVVGNARCVPICVRVRMPRASITRHPRGCILSIFNLSVESATLSLDSTIEDRDRIEISERRKMKRPLAGDFPTSRIEGNKIYFRHILHSLSLRRRLAVVAMSAAR